VLLAIAGLIATAGAAAARYDAEIARTKYGVPHITSKTWGGTGYGYGYAQASDYACTLAANFVTVRGDRSRFFGPTARYTQEANGTRPTNLASDAYFRWVMRERRVEKLIAPVPPLGPSAEARALVRGYVAGYNRFVRNRGAQIKDPACRGKPWVRQIEPIDVYRRVFQLLVISGEGIAFDEMVSAAPLLGGSPAAAEARAARAWKRLDPRRLQLRAGSNAFAFGRDATTTGKGILLGNPHFPWNGPERFWQSHLRIPGKLNVQGGTLLGVPGVNIGFTRNVAWSHTVSTALRFTPFELQLALGDPFSYVVDGQRRRMKVNDIDVPVRRADGQIVNRRQRIYSTDHGPVITSLLGLPLFPWTPLTAYALQDANASQMRILDQFIAFAKAQSTAGIDRALRTHQGIPWVNTIAADSQGNAYYADVGVIPNVPDSKATGCAGLLGRVTFPLLGIPILDGSRSACDWGRDADALQPGTFGPSHMPTLTRADYTSNMNDSYWLTNPRKPLEGFARIIGPERSERSLRTRSGLMAVEDKLNSGGRFGRADVQQLAFANRPLLASMWRDRIAAMCEARGTVPTSSGPVDVRAACPVLRGWDLRENVDSRGSLLWDRFMGQAQFGGYAALLGGPLGTLVGTVEGIVPLAPPPFTTPFDAADPVRTPYGVDPNTPFIQAALGDAVRDLRGAGIPLDAPQGRYKFALRGKERIPAHGGAGEGGELNDIEANWNGKGWDPVYYGSSYMQVVAFRNGSRCPSARTLVTYSQSDDPTSRHLSDQTRLFSAKRWTNAAFCQRDVRRATRSKLRLRARR
jgi:acyl-homoserine-lactone acylase